MGDRPFAVTVSYLLLHTLNHLSDVRAQGRRGKKVFVLRELHRVIIYTNKMSKQVTQSHVRCSSQCTV
jgi:hypothetical protein